MASPNAVTIPVIDMSADDESVGRALVDASEKYGFVFVRNLGYDIPQSEIDEAFDISREFFNSPKEQKEKCKITSDNRGWSSMGTEKLDPDNQKRGDFKEAFNLSEFINNKAQQPLPSVLADHETQLAQFSARCHALCMKILELFAVGLAIPEEEGGKGWFSSRHDPARGKSGSVFRLLYYPATDSSSYDAQTDIRAGAHSDYGSITLLFQQRNAFANSSASGLEILTAANEWVPVPLDPRSSQTAPPSSSVEVNGKSHDEPLPILVNIGDLLSFWTGGLLKSTVHRVVAPHDVNVGARARYSIVYFCHPVNSTQLVPVPSEVVKEKIRKDGAGKENGVGSTNVAKVMTAAEHLHSRLAATYGWKKE